MRTKAAIFLLLATLPAAAQELESLAGIRMNFEQPGARALAMGGTLAGNPADLAGASRTFSIEARRNTTEARYFSDAQLGTTAVEASIDGLTSASLVLPFGRTTWSASYDVPLDVERTTFTTLAALFPSAPVGQFFLCDGRVAAVRCAASAPPLFFLLPAALPIDASLRLERYSTAGAWSSGPLSLGAAVRYERLRQQTSLSGLSIATESIDDSDVTYSAGARWKLSQRMSIRGAYESGGTFRGERSFPEIPPYEIELRTPSSLRGGISIDVLPQLTVAADAVRVNYSEMSHDQRAIFPQSSELGYPDVTELHAGAEYRLGNVSLRAGWWRDPAHAFAILNGVEPLPPFGYVGAIVDDDEDHVTAGIGVGSGAVRVDASIDRGSRSTRAAVGLTTRF